MKLNCISTMTFKIFDCTFLVMYLTVMLLHTPSFTTTLLSLHRQLLVRNSVLAIIKINDECDPLHHIPKAEQANLSNNSTPSFFAANVYARQS